MSLTINELLRHLKVVNHRNFRSGCCIGECGVGQFESFAALKSHLYRKHYIRPSTSSDEEDESHSVYNLQVDTDALFQETSQDGLQTQDIQADVDRLLEVDQVQQKRSSALFLMKLKELYRLSQVAIDYVVSGCRELIKDTCQRLKAGVRQKLAETGVDANTTQAIDTVFDELYDPFTGLDTEYIQSKYINETFKVVVSMFSPLKPGSQ